VIRLPDIRRWILGREFVDNQRRLAVLLARLEEWHPGEPLPDDEEATRP
jgi:hypothetical protein